MLPGQSGLTGRLRKRQPENGDWNKVTVSLSGSTSVLQPLGQEMPRTHKYHLWVKQARRNRSAQSGLLSPLCACTGWGPSSPAVLRLRITGIRLGGRVEHTRGLPWKGSTSQVTAGSQLCPPLPTSSVSLPTHLFLPSGGLRLPPGLPSDLSLCLPTSSRKPSR